MDEFKVVSKFITWYKTKTQKQKDFASALMMSELTDDQLLGIKNHTDELADIIEKLDEVKKP